MATTTNRPADSGSPSGARLLEGVALLVPAPRDIETELAGLSDVELITRLFDRVQSLKVEDDNALDRLYFMLDEAIERFAPSAAWEARCQNIRANESRQLLERALSAERERFAGRAAARALARPFGDDEGQDA